MNPFANRPRCYIASPLGFTEAGRHYYEQVYLPELGRVVTPIDPWALTTTAEIAAAEARNESREMALEIGRRNLDAIRSCSLLAAYLDGQEADSGTVAELGFAAGLGIRCFGLRTDLRQAGEPGVALNLQVEAFIVMTGGRITATLAELLTSLKDEAERHLHGQGP